MHGRIRIIGRPIIGWWVFEGFTYVARVKIEKIKGRDKVRDEVHIYAKRLVWTESLCDRVEARILKMPECENKILCTYW